MKNIMKNPFAGLPSTLVNELLSKSGQIAYDIYEPFREISTDRDKLRDQLQKDNIVQNDSMTDGCETPTSCGVDGYYCVERILATDLACCVAFGVEGLVPPSGEKQWDNPLYLSLFHCENNYPETINILRAVKMEMAIELAASAPHNIIFFKGSLSNCFETIMRTLQLALALKESLTSKAFITRVKTSIRSLKTIVDSENTGKMWVGIPRNASKKELIKKLNWQMNYDENMLFTILLSPGEFTSPLPVDQSELLSVKNIPIKDEQFVSVRDNLISSLEQLHFLYYRPYDWTPVFRIEIARSVVEDHSRLALLLNGIKYQCCSAGITGPYPLYRANKMVESFTKALPVVRKSVTSNIMNLHTQDLKEIFPLLMFTGSDTGDENE